MAPDQGAVMSGPETGRRPGRMEGAQPPCKTRAASHAQRLLARSPETTDPAARASAISGTTRRQSRASHALPPEGSFPRPNGLPARAAAPAPVASGELGVEAP